MEHRSAMEQLRHAGIDVDNNFSHGRGLKSNYCSWSQALRRDTLVGGYPIAQNFGSKFESPRDVFEGAKWVATSKTHRDVKESQQHGISPEVEAREWLRENPCEVPSSGGFGRSELASLGVTGGCEGVQDVGLGNMKMDWSQFLYEAQASASRTPRWSRDLSEYSAAQTPATANLYSQLTKVSESAIWEGIGRHGGGQKGLQAVIEGIVMWVRDRTRAFSQSSAGTHPELAEASEELMWCNAGHKGVVVGDKSRSLECSGHNNPENVNRFLQEDMNRLLSSNPATSGDGGGSLCDFKIGCSRVIEKQSNVPFSGVGRGGGLLDGMGSEESALLRKSDSRVSSGLATETLLREGTGKVSPSSDHNGLLPLDIRGYDNSSSHWKKMRRLSPSPSLNSSSEGRSELSPTSGILPHDILDAPDIFDSVGANPFASGGPFSLGPSSPSTVDPHSMDTGHFSPFSLHVTNLMDDNSGLMDSARGCGLMDSLGSLATTCSVPPDTEQVVAAPRMGLLSKTKTSNSACTRLARRKRMVHNRKAASHHASRVAHTVAAAGASPGAMCANSSGSRCGMVRSQELVASEGQCRTKDRRDHEQLQCVLQKVLRPSDVGNLGRIVLPKRDAESHLPYLGAREGVQFACEDYDTGEKMMLRYRFWPNNKSRMYLLENTGDFVRKHRLQESDGLLIYRNQQKGTFILRARKARDCVAESSAQVEAKKGEGEKKDMSSPQKKCSGVEIPSESVVTSVASVATLQDDLLNFADLPDAPMGYGAENLVRFPSLEAYDVEMLDLAQVAADHEKQQQETRVGASSTS